MKLYKFNLASLPIKKQRACQDQLRRKEVLVILKNFPSEDQIVFDQIFSFKKGPVTDWG